MAILSKNLYVRPEGRKYLSEGHYVFSVDNKSISEHYVLNPFWNWVTANFLPMTIAPNLVTFLGFLFMVLSFIVITFYYPYGDVSNPYVLILVPTCIFIYQTLDGCDGKQARRTKASSPLGELFDHGVDALCMTILAQQLQIILGLSANNCPLNNAWMHISMWITFYVAHWEHYHTQNFFMGEIGACDGQLIIVGVMIRGILATIWEPHLYPTIVHYYQNNTFIVPFLNIEVTYGAGWIAFAHFNGLLSIIRPIVAVFLYYYHGKDKNEKEREVSTKRSSFVNALIDLVPVVTMALTFFVWSYINHTYSAPITPIKAPVGSPLPDITTVWGRDSMWLIVTAGLAFGIYLTTINISRVTNQKFEYFSFQNIVTIGVMLIQITNSLIRVYTGSAIVCETCLLRCMTIVMAIIYLDFVTDISRNFSEAMNIWVFQLGKRDDQTHNKSD
jgi:ethanolaminephosphotransferase